MNRQSTLFVLARELDARWRIRRFLEYLAFAWMVSAAASLLVLIGEIALFPELVVWRIILLLNGAALVAGLILAAARAPDPLRLLADADRVYDTKALLTSAADFLSDESSHSPGEQAFRDVVIRRGEEFAPSVDVGTVYPLSLPRRAPIAIAIVAAIGIVLLLDASGWFRGPAVELVEEGFLLEDAARRLADRTDNEELNNLADELRRLGERLQDGEMDADEARRRIDNLAERVEEQVRDLERLGEFDTNQDVQIPPEAESTVRNALRSGMTEGEVLEYFMSLRSDGDNLPDVLSKIEEARLDRPPDAELDLDDERVQKLLDQLNLNPETNVPSDISDELEFARQTLQQAGSGVQQLSEGDELGEAGQNSTDARGGSAGDSEPSGPGRDMEGEGGSGQSGGEKAVTDAMDDTFARIEDANPVFRQIEGVVGEGTIRDVIIRELPSEAISQLDEAEREVAFNLVIEEAVRREDVPPELHQLLRNYFLRITLGSDQGDADEQ